MNFGLIGAIVIAISWIPEIERTIISKDIRGLDVKFVLLYLLGSVLLFVHALDIRDLPFAIVNGLLSLMAIVQLFVIVSRRWRNENRH